MSRSCSRCNRPLDDLKGGDGGERRHHPCHPCRRGRGPRRDAVLLNAAHALFVAAKTDTALEGWELASSVIDDGMANRKLDELTGA